MPPLNPPADGGKVRFFSQWGEIGGDPFLRKGIVLLDLVRIKCVAQAIADKIDGYDGDKN